MKRSLAEVNMPTTRVFLRPIHVVHVDDAAVARAHVKGILDACTYPEFVVHSFEDLAAAGSWAGPSPSQLDCVLLDLTLRVSTGTDTLQQALTIFYEVPILVLTDTLDADVACEMVLAGAENYLTKDLVRSGHLPLFIAKSVARAQRRLGGSPRINQAMALMRGIMDRLPSPALDPPPASPG